MSTTPTTSRPDHDDLDVRALTQFLTVLEDVGRARDAEDLFIVVSESGSEYLVDIREGACECPDHEYRGRKCKHIRRVEFATGCRPVPAGIAVDEQLGMHLDESPTDADQ
jgi:hypothetical protein